MEWRGKETFNLFDNYNVTDRFGGESGYMAMSIKSMVEGGFKQEVKGLLKSVESIGTHKDYE